MSHTVRVSVSISEGAFLIGETVNEIVEGCDKRSEKIVDGASDYAVTLGIDVSSLKIFAMKADGGALTVKTNSSGAPQETFVLADDHTLLWREGDAAIFAGDVSILYVSNSSGGDVFLNIISATDTP